MRSTIIAVILFTGIIFTGGNAMALEITSSAFSNEGAIPAKYTCKGVNEGARPGTGAGDGNVFKVGIAAKIGSHFAVILSDSEESPDSPEILRGFYPEFSRRAQDDVLGASMNSRRHRHRR